MIDIYVNGVIIYMQISQFSQRQFLICWFTGTNGRDGGQGPKGIGTITKLLRFDNYSRKWRSIAMQIYRATNAGRG